MSLRIRLARGGAKKRPFYRIVVADTRMPRDGRFIEKLGTYNPMLPKDDPARVVLVNERIEHWLSIGATPSTRIARMLAAADMRPAPEIRPQTKKDKPRAKTLERLAAQEEKRKASEESKAEIPTEEPAAEISEDEAADPDGGQIGNSNIADDSSEESKVEIDDGSEKEKPGASTDKKEG